MAARRFFLVCALLFALATLAALVFVPPEQRGRQALVGALAAVGFGLAAWRAPASRTLCARCGEPRGDLAFCVRCGHENR